MFNNNKEQLNQINKILTAQGAQLNQIESEQTTMAADLTTISAQVAASVTVEQSAITLINGLANQISLLANDPVALQNLSNTLANSAQSLSADIVANTPAAPVVPLVPVVPVITSITPTTGVIGTPVTIVGTGFGTLPVTGVGPITSQTPTEIVAPVTTGIIQVGSSNILTFVVLPAAAVTAAEAKKA